MTDLLDRVFALTGQIMERMGRQTSCAMLMIERDRLLWQQCSDDERRLYFAWADQADQEMSS